MKQFISILSLAALLLYNGVASEAQAAQPNPTRVQEFKWEHFGADPAYETREAAMADRANVFRKFGYSEPQVTCLVQATAVPGKIVRLNVGDHLDHMLSGNRVVHANVLIAFADAQRGIEYTARAEEWTATCGGKTITVDLPQVCNNWSDRATPVPVQGACAALRLHIPAGSPDRAIHERIVRGTTLRHEPITDFNCWGIIAGQYREGGQRDCDTCDWTSEPIEKMREYGYGVVTTYNTFIYVIPSDVRTNADGSVDVTVIWPAITVKEGSAVCIEVDGVTYPAYVILPPSWKGLEVELPLDAWTNPRIINP